VNIVYGCCVGSWERLQRNVIPAVKDNLLITISGQTSIATAYNAILNLAVSGEAAVDVLVLLHDDLEITDPYWEEKLRNVLSMGNIGILGIAGGTRGNGIAWWNHSPIGHQQTDVMLIDFGVRSGFADLLEGSLLAITERGLGRIYFDTQYPGFHGYDVDICAQVAEAGLSVVVADIDTHHHTQMGFKSGESHRDWLKADEIFRRKWE
jgi:hypothetical protein